VKLHLEPNLPYQVLLYQAPDGRARLEGRMQDETVWLTQAQMAELFQTTQQNVSLYFRNIYEEGELTPEATHKESLSVRPKGQVQPSATLRKFLVVRREGSPVQNSVCADSARTAAD
jgi:hypothetical protein